MAQYWPNITQISAKYYPDIVQILSRYCPKHWLYIAKILYEYCLDIAQILYKYCTNIVQILSQYCLYIVQILCKYCLNIVKILNKHPIILYLWSKILIIESESVFPIVKDCTLIGPTWPNPALWLVNLEGPENDLPEVGFFFGSVPAVLVG